MKYTVYVTDNVTGRIDWAERIFGGGLTAGTYTWWRLVAFAGIVLSICWMLGWLSFGSTPVNQQKINTPGAPHPQVQTP